MSDPRDRSADAGFDASALRGLPLIEAIEVHAELGSTNDRAKELAPSAAKLPLLVVADRQTAGRGRGGHRWHTSDGALTFSLLIDPTNHELSLGKQGLLSLATGIAVIDAVQRTTGLAAGLKWPNDVLLENKKLAGTLIEAPRPDRLVIGVGVNVNNRLDEAPADVAARAISLVEAVGQEVSRPRLLEAFLHAFSMRLNQLASAEADLLQSVRGACILTGQLVTLTDGDRTTAGTCRGIADDGALRIETSEGVQACRAGSVIRSENHPRLP